MTEIIPDLFASQASSKKPKHIYTVSQITQDIKLILENTFGQVWVEGEISGLRKINSGTIFFSLKDNTSILKCVVFFSFARGIKFELKDGLKVICSGGVGVYEKDGQYQLYIEQIEPKGIGSLQLALEQLKEKLEKEGLFAAGHKRPIPYLPSCIGIVTSPSGAAIKDMLKVLGNRFKEISIIINPVRVQGDGAKEDIASAIKDFNLFNEKAGLSQRIEVMIVGRGGGSIEDLWAFNEEIVCRAIYNSKIPVISAVGHERDWTIADLVADLRVPTPSVAAELVIPKKEDLRKKIDDSTAYLTKAFAEKVLTLKDATRELIHRLNIQVEHVLSLSQEELASASKKLALLNPANLILRHQEKIEDLARQIYIRMKHFLDLLQSEFAGTAEKLSSLSPLNILSRGYSITFKAEGNKIIKDAALLKSGDILKTRLHKGEVTSQVTEVKKNGGDQV